MAAAERLLLTKARRTSYAAIAVSTTLIIALPLAYLLNIWQDEAYTLHTTSGDLAYAFHESVAFEQNAPLYFLLLTLWRHLDGSIFFLRLFSVLCAAGTIALIPGLARRYLPRVDPMYPTFAVAWNPFFIWAALEMRVYAMIIVISAALLWTFFDAFLEQRPRWSAAAAYAACVAVALYTQYYLAFLIAAQAVTLLVYRPRALVRFLPAALAGAAVFVPMLFVVPGQVQNFRGAFTRPASVLHAAVGLAGILARYVLPLVIAHAKLVYAVLALALAALCILARRAFTASGDGVIAVMTAAAFTIFSIAVYAAGVHVLNRHLAALYVPAIFTVFSAITFLRPSVRERVTAVWFGTAMIASWVALVHTYAPLAKPGDWTRATAFIAAHEQAHEPIAVFEAENALPLAYYYRGPNAIVAIPRPVDFRHYDVTRFVVHDEGDLAAAMPRSDRIWLITAGQCTSANIVFGCAPVERFIAARYRVEADASFFGSRARLLRLLPARPASLPRAHGRASS